MQYLYESIITLTTFIAVQIFFILRSIIEQFSPSALCQNVPHDVAGVYNYLLA